ncbi:MAG: glycosyltransferase family 4 protein [Chloroflexota bacterium]|nr:glycosyltransferase family 4 protein [Chloroflexota bacterium]
MHILTVSNYAPPYGGGIQFVIANMTRVLVAHGHRVTLLAADTGIPRGRSTWEGADRIGLPASNVLERRSVPLPLFDPIALWRTLDGLLPTVDVVHVHGMLYLDCVLTALRGRRHGVGVILTEHVGMVPYSTAFLRIAQRAAIASLGRLCVRACDAVVVLNERVAAEMRPLMRRDAALVTIPNGVDRALFYPPTDRAALRAQLGLTRPTLLFAGRLAEKKGVPLVLEAARHLSDCDVVICGQDTERLIGTALADNVRVIGKVDQPTLARWQGAADALILPSEGEGFPLVVQEALACGTPVIVTDDATNRAYLDERVAVFVPRDADAIAHAAGLLLHDEARLHAMREAARSGAHGGWDATVAAYMRLYHGF